MRKRFTIVAQKNLEFRLDAFNAFNRINYNNPQLNASNADFGTITSAKTPRELQFSLRFEF